MLAIAVLALALSLPTAPRLAPAAATSARRSFLDLESRPQRRELILTTMAAFTAMPPTLAHASYALQARGP